MRRGQSTNLFISEGREFSAIRKEVLVSLQSFMENKLQLDDRIKESSTSFTKFTASEDEVGEVHISLASDVVLRELRNLYDDITKVRSIKKTQSIS